MVDLPILLLVALSFGSAMLGTLGGLGGAMFLVPLLILFDVEPATAASLGILTVAAGSLAAAPRQLREGTVHHRLGVTIEIAASGGAIVGAVVGNAVSGTVLTRSLALVAIVAAAATFRRGGLRNPPHELFAAETPGEWPGTLAGAYRLRDDAVVPYQARRLPLGLASMVAAGVVSGLAGVGGGFIKTPALSEIMGVPVKVAAATSTFTVGVTAATGLLVFAGQGRIDFESAPVIVLGGLLGGAAGALVQQRIPPQAVRSVLAIALVIVGIVLLVRS